MSLTDLFYRFRPITPQALPAAPIEQTLTLTKMTATLDPPPARTVNRKSEAMKKVWADRKAREAGK